MIIFVEGKSDRDFLKIYLKYLNIDDQAYEIEIVGNGDGGKDNIINTKKIEKKMDKFLVIFDADDDHNASKDNIKKQIEKINPNASYEVFLFPNDKETGCLEDIYKKIAIKNNFICCFKKYEECINKDLKENEKVNLSAKSLLYAYLEACGLETNVDKIKIAELQKIFNFKDEYLTKLKDFLEKHCGSEKSQE